MTESRYQAEVVRNLVASNLIDQRKSEEDVPLADDALEKYQDL